MKLQKSVGHLTAVRGLAACMVLFSHIFQVFWIRILGLGSPLQLLASEASRLAVLAFFVLSGFVIAASVESNIERYGRFQLREYFASRFARIYPPFLMAVAISVGMVLVLQAFQLPGSLGPLGFPGDVYRARDFITAPESEVLRSLLMLSGLGEPNGALWSLFIEAKVYFVFAAIILILVSHRRISGAIVLAAALLPGLAYNDQFCRYAAFWLIGCVLFYVTTPGAPKGRLLLSLLSVASFLIADVAMRLTANAPLADTVTNVAFETASALAIGLVVFFVPLRTELMERIGDFSYSLYVFHLPILLLIQSLTIAFLGPSLAATIAASCTAVLAAFGAAMLGGVVERRRDQIRAVVSTAITSLISRSRLTVASLRSRHRL